VCMKFGLNAVYSCESTQLTRRLALPSRLIFDSQRLNVKVAASGQRQSSCFNAAIVLCASTAARNGEAYWTAAGVVWHPHNRGTYCYCFSLLRTVTVCRCVSLPWWSSRRLSKTILHPFYRSSAPLLRAAVPVKTTGISFLQSAIRKKGVHALVVFLLLCRLDAPNTHNVHVSGCRSAHGSIVVQYEHISSPSDSSAQVCTHHHHLKLPGMVTP